MNGYAELHDIGIKARADVLEIIAGYPDEHRIDREIAFAYPALTPDDPETYRWLACLLAAKLDYMEARSCRS